jgi:hypothetical protein
LSPAYLKRVFRSFLNAFESVLVERGNFARLDNLPGDDVGVFVQEIVGVSKTIGRYVIDAGNVPLGTMSQGFVIIQNAITTDEHDGRRPRSYIHPLFVHSWFVEFVLVYMAVPVQAIYLLFDCPASPDE